MSSVLQESSAHSYNKMISMAKEAADKLVELLFKSYLDSSSKLNILDLGCGPGYLCNSLADRLGDKGDITGVDPDPERIKLAMELYGDKSNVKFAVAGDQDFPEGLYDVIIATSVVHWIKDKDLMFKRIHDNLKPGGYFAFTSSDGPFRPDIMVEVIESLGPQVIQDTFGTQFYESADYYRQVAPSYGFEVAFMEVRNPSFNYPNIHSAIDFIYGAFHGRFNRSSPAVKEIIQKYEELQTSFVMTNPRLTVILKKVR
jgi:SAM-dependent methyltransferase